jgi:hypothetical protein
LNRESTPGLAARGNKVYAANCADCHQLIDRDARVTNCAGRITNPSFPIAQIGTDPRQAVNFATRQITLGSTQQPLGFWLKLLTDKIVGQYTGRSEERRAGAPVHCDRSNDFQAIEAYRARPLNGIWATAPYLHNGSVPDMMELLKPPAERPTKFYVGGWEFDPENLGFDWRSPFPGAFEFDTSVAGTTDVIESSPAFFAVRKPRAPRRDRAAGRNCSENRRDAQRPLVAGISVAHHEITAGTLGYFCRSLKLGDDPSVVYILSNNHVLADINQGRPGDDIYQPGPADNGTHRDHVAELRRFVPIDLDGQPNRVDAAIAELLPEICWQQELCEIGPIADVGRADEGAEVRKHGRTTGYTEGVVTDASYDAIVGMDPNNPNIVGIFQDQMRIEPTEQFLAIGLGGDSGSLIVSRSAPPRAVGLYFANPPDGSYGIANHITHVLAEMQVELLTAAPAAAAEGAHDA